MPPPAAIHRLLGCLIWSVDAVRDDLRDLALQTPGAMLSLIANSTCALHNWAEDAQRCQAAGVPLPRQFSTKLQLARSMLCAPLRSTSRLAGSAAMTADHGSGPRKKIARRC
jgi:hypothetical protein